MIFGVVPKNLVNNICREKEQPLEKRNLSSLNKKSHPKTWGDSFFCLKIVFNPCFSGIVPYVMLMWPYRTLYDIGFILKKHLI